MLSPMPMVKTYSKGEWRKCPSGPCLGGGHLWQFQLNNTASDCSNPVGDGEECGNLAALDFEGGDFGRESVGPGDVDRPVVKRVTTWRRRESEEVSKSGS